MESSLHRNGAVLTKRDADGSDYETVGLTLEKVASPIINGRMMTGQNALTYAANGFELLDAPLRGSELDFFDHKDIVTRYYEQCAQLVTRHTGAHAFAFDHNVRSASGKHTNKQVAGGQPVQAPIHVVHGDYTLASAPQRVRDLSRQPTVNDTLRETLRDGEPLLSKTMAEAALSGGRFAIVNVWRNIAPQPVAVRPLALCDGRSVAIEDLVVFEIHYEDRVGENYFAKHTKAHRWYYFPQMTRAEALLIKQWDSHGVLAQSNGTKGDGSVTTAPCTFSFHSAFKDPESPSEAPDRWSIEVRCMVIYD